MPASSADSTILVLEDDRELGLAVAEVLEDEGYPVVVAANGREGLELIESGRVRPALILLDLMMPVLNGWQFKARLDQLGSSVPLVVCTADGHAARKAAELGATGHLRKPPTLTALLEVVQRLLSGPPGWSDRRPAGPDGPPAAR